MSITKYIKYTDEREINQVSFWLSSVEMARRNNAQALYAGRILWEKL